VLLPGVRALAADYDDFIVDLWGVVHDGGAPFDGVIGALEGLAEAGRRVLFVTNTSRLGDEVEATLVGRLGIARRLFHDVVSSGDLTRAAILDRDRALFDGLPTSPRCVHLGDPGYVPWIFDLGLDFATDAELPSADLVVVTGAPRDERGLEEMRVRLSPLAARGVPLLCTNPDRIIPSAAGAKLGPGAVAHAYAELGGRAVLYGKPHPPIYAEAKRRLGSDASRRLVALGDLLATDIRGAHAAGIASVLVVRTGGHASELTDAAAAEALFARERLRPDMMLDRFAW
jgi:HAD superfamily hydrolase (TIGR01459 family)